MIIIVSHVEKAEGYYKVERRGIKGEPFSEPGWSIDSCDSPFVFKHKIDLIFNLDRYRVYVDGKEISKHWSFKSALRAFEAAKLTARKNVVQEKLNHDLAFLKINKVPHYAWPHNYRSTWADGYGDGV